MAPTGPKLIDPERWRRRLSRGLTRLGFSADWYLIPIAALIGVLGGLVATGFERAVHWIARGPLWLAHEGVPFAVTVIVLAPAVGGLLVGLLNRKLFPGWTREGVPDVVEALAKREDRLRGRSAALKAVGSSLTMGSGGSAGIEGPIIYIGSCVSAVTTRVLGVGRRHTQTLVGCGAAAGTAAIFNAPIAGVLFVLEVILRDFSIRTFVPIVVASVFGTAVAQALLGRNEALFQLPADIHAYEFVIAELIPFAVLGLVCGLLGVLFTRGLHRTQRWANRTPIADWLRPAAGGLVLGGLGLAYLWAFGNVVGGRAPAFFGNGYRVTERMLDPQLYQAAGTGVGIGLLAVLCVSKLLATWITLGSGGSGGIFAPSLFIGASLGGLVGVAVQATGLLPEVTPAAYALAGMAGVLAAVAHCPLTAFMLTFEITRDYKVILPMMLVAILATVVAQAIRRDSVYDTWLRTRGLTTGSMKDMFLLRGLRVSDLTLTPAVMVQADDPAARLLQLAEDYAAVDYVVTDEATEQYQGMVVGADVRAVLVQREAIPLMIVGELMRTELPTVTRDETLDVVLDKFARHDVSSLPAVDETGRAIGMVTRARLMRRYRQALRGR